MITGHRKKSGRIFYGWYVLSIGMAGAFLASGTSQLFMSIMLKPLTEEFGWSRTAATGAITAGSLLAGLFSVFFGRLADRYGPRLLATAGAIATSCAYFALTKLTSLWQFYVIYIGTRVIVTNTLSNITPQTAAVNWFRRYRGRALGMLSMATPLGSSILALVAQLLMENHGWRSVFTTFAVAMLVLQALPAALFLRRRPEDMGLYPDGIEDSGQRAKEEADGPSGRENSFSLREALRTGSLWIIIAAAFLALMVNAGTGFHLVAYYTDVGLPASIAVQSLSLYAFTGAFSNLIWGFLAERISERFLASAVMVLTSGTILYLQTVRTPAASFAFAVLFGLTSRGEGTLVNVILAQYYGRASYGSISGFVFPFNMLGLGFGPLVCSISFDLTGSYNMVFDAFAGISFIAAVLFWLAKKPYRRHKIEK